MKTFLPLLICLLFCATDVLANRFDYTTEAKTIYEKILSLRFREADILIARMKTNDPGNLIVYHLEDYIDFFTVYINENKQEFERLEKNRDKRLEAIKSGDKNSPYYLYLQADIRLHWALARLKFDGYATAFFEVNKAFKLLVENEEKFPDFVANKKNLGILHALVGTIPDNYRWAVEMFSSLEGTVDQGQQELRQVIQYAQHKPFIFERETYIIYSYVMLFLGNDEDEAWQIINESNLDPQVNPMAAFVLANVGMRTGRNDHAIRILENRPRSRAFHSFPYMDFMLGQAKLQRLDKDAHLHLQAYLDNFNGNNFVKESYRRLAWHALVHGDTPGYKRYMQKVLTKGKAFTGGDESAMKEAQSGEVPHVGLLKARLLFDGGYYEKANAVLQQQSANALGSSKNRLEYYYRYGRVTHALEKYTEALQYYQRAIEIGRYEPWYYACRAALEQGNIYERKGDYKKAKAAFRDCISIRPDEHRTVLHQQAKAGLARLKRFEG